MKREIKFRGKSIYGNIWVYGNLIHSKRFSGCSNEYRIHDIDTGLEHDVIPETVGQFTGIKDKNGVDIFEGDKCLIKASEPLFTEQFSTDYDWAITAEVRYNLDYCGFIFKDFAICSIFELNSVDAEIEVIGNIYRNTELIDKIN